MNGWMDGRMDGWTLIRQCLTAPNPKGNWQKSSLIFIVFLITERMGLTLLADARRRVGRRVEYYNKGKKNFIKIWSFFSFSFAFSLFFSSFLNGFVFVFVCYVCLVRAQLLQ